MHLDRNVSRSLSALATGLMVAWPGFAADSFHKLRDAEIRARLAGMETTDGVHWAEQYMRDGAFKMFSMGKLINGKWSVRKGMLCLDDGKSDLQAPLGCKEVWLSGNKIEFRVPDSGLPAFEGVLQKQQPRK